MVKKQLWARDDRYSMNNESFEIFNNYTTTRLVTDIHQHDFYEVLFFLQGEARFLSKAVCIP